MWLEIVKPTIAITTYSSYSGMVKGIIVPYFKKKGITLSELKATDIQAFYMEQLNRVSANSVIHYHANIHKALKYAVKIDLIPSNPADKIERPKKIALLGASMIVMRWKLSLRQRKELISRFRFFWGLSMGFAEARRLV